ncbi:hypothetical protein QP518_04285 [Peptoniphilus harei]|uniref:hypothetical protein n=1 Tax=Peptoniphilus TaxID=162289 RepID=UPI0023F9EA84|nr:MULTISPECIES: hypothetical protein [Peptoniphilus]MDK7354962.1 hypothetical protein [Peptoniphilus harei]MDK7370636.1 hypothetical protein [Peptoniphilus harei]MDU4045495.1 hypothetical protein [Peptoniphilus harei]MDU5323072.1 hypothetical protein [Peptoniphilus harei]
MTKNNENIEVIEEKYTKDAILRAEKLSWNKDVLNILLEDDKEYTLSEVEKIVNDFNTREVK